MVLLNDPNSVPAEQFPVHQRAIVGREDELRPVGVGVAGLEQLDQFPRQQRVHAAIEFVDYQEGSLVERVQPGAHQSEKALRAIGFGFQEVEADGFPNVRIDQRASGYGAETSRRRDL